MSILIRGEEMPKNCVVCKNYYYCELWSKLTVNKRCKERHPDCPIVEVKEPHGKLIDVSKLNIHDVSPTYGFCVMGVTEEDIELAETVIEAEGNINE